MCERSDVVSFKPNALLAFLEAMSDTPLDISPSDADGLLDDLRQLINETRAAVAATVNVGLTMLYWRIGRRINEEILQGERAEYGKQIVATLSQQLTEEYGSGFSYSALTRMMKFAEVFPDLEIVATLSQQLSWSHFRDARRGVYSRKCLRCSAL